ALVSTNTKIYRTNLEGQKQTRLTTLEKPELKKQINWHKKLNFITNGFSIEEVKRKFLIAFYVRLKTWEIVDF
uniref:hypothetical protein n=1 Tax=Holdemania filiformis TaxID=61171 RepID=UPI0022DEAD76